MKDQQPLAIVFAWWNTSLSPSVKPDRADDRTKQIAAQVVRLLLDHFKVDFLALGEVTSADLDYLAKKSGTSGYSVSDGTLRTGRLKFDTGVFTNNDTLQVLNMTSITDEYAGVGIKVANRFDLLVAGAGDLMHAFVCHWPSRLWCQEGHPKRDKLAIRLYAAVQEVGRASRDSPHVVLLGDFNDEPFDRSLSGHLFATRDRGLARQNARFLYNPFWRHLGEVQPHVPKQCRKTFSGTCFYGSGDVTRWRTFDQIMFSASFLHDSSWRLNEKYSAVLQMEPLVDFIRDPKHVFDHFPVMSVVQHKTMEVTDDD
jgi:hypothetical protein